MRLYRTKTTVTRELGGHVNAAEGERKLADYHERLRKRAAAGVLRDDLRASADDIERYRRQGFDDEP